MHEFVCLCAYFYACVWLCFVLGGHRSVTIAYFRAGLGFSNSVRNLVILHGCFLLVRKIHFGLCFLSLIPDNFAERGMLMEEIASIL